MMTILYRVCVYSDDQKSKMTTITETVLSRHFKVGGEIFEVGSNWEMQGIEHFPAAD